MPTSHLAAQLRPGKFVLRFAALLRVSDFARFAWFAKTWATGSPDMTSLTWPSLISCHFVFQLKQFDWILKASAFCETSNFQSSTSWSLWREQLYWEHLIKRTLKLFLKKVKVLFIEELWFCRFHIFKPLEVCYGKKKKKTLPERPTERGSQPRGPQAPVVGASRPSAIGHGYVAIRHYLKLSI